MFSANLSTNVKIGTYHVDPAIVKNLRDIKHVTVKQYSSQAQADQALHNYQVDSIIVKQDRRYDVAHANIDSSKTTLAKLHCSFNSQRTFKKRSKNWLPICPCQVSIHHLLLVRLRSIPLINMAMLIPTFSIRSRHYWRDFSSFSLSFWSRESDSCANAAVARLNDYWQHQSAAARLLAAICWDMEPWQSFKPSLSLPLHFDF